MRLFITLITITFFFTCKNTNSEETPKNTGVEVDTLKKEEVLKPIDKSFYAVVDKLRLRAEPNKKGTVLEQIEEGGELFFLNEKTDFVEKIKLRDKMYEEPWLKVKSKKGNEGWVFGGAVTEDAPVEDITKTPYDDCALNYSMNRDYGAYYKCVTHAKEAEIKKDQRYIKVTETGYQVTLLSGETRNLVNANGQDDDEGLREYEYRYYLKKLGYFIFRINRYEAGDYIMMNDKFGYVTPLSGMPKMSPDRNKIVITNADPDAGFEFNGIQLMELTDEGFNTLFEEELDGFAPHNPVWVNEKNIEFDFLSSGSADKEWKVKAKLSADENGVWGLTINNRRE